MSGYRMRVFRDAATGWWHVTQALPTFTFPHRGPTVVCKTTSWVTAIRFADRWIRTYGKRS